MIYLDSSAAVKLVRHEQHTHALETFLAGSTPDALASSKLIEVELPRALRRSAPEALPQIDTLLRRLHRFEINERVRGLAAGFQDPQLRSLDAIHLATALILNRETGDLGHFVAYDNRLLDVAAARDLPIASPGMRR